MTVAMTVTLYGDTPDRPCTLITITGLTVGDTVDVTRQAPSEEAQRVRGLTGRIVTNSAAIVVDTTPPLGRITTYTLLVNGAYVTSTTVTVPFTGTHLLTDVVTGNGVSVRVLRDSDDRTQPARVTVLQPVGSAYPIALYDERGSDNGTLNVHTGDRADTLALAALLATGHPIASRHANDGCDIASVEYVYPQDVTRSRFTNAGSRLWSLPFIAIDLPDPKLDSVVVTLNDINNYYSPSSGTLATINSDYTTLLEIAQDDFGTL